MRLALLGADADTLALATAIVARAEHRLVAVCECQATPFAAPLARLKLPQLETWETLLDSQFVDAVVVAYSPDEDRRADQLRKFVQAGIPLLAAHPLFDSMLVYYELDMIRRDTQCVMLPYLPNRWHPAIIELARLFAGQAEGPLGPIEQVLFERQLLDRTKATVKGHFARDVDLLRAICGEVTRLHAMGADVANLDATESSPVQSQIASTSYGSLSVQMSGDSGVLTRWSVAPADAISLGRLTLVGSSGRAVVTMPDDDTPWTFELSAGGRRLDRQLDAAWSPAEISLDLLARAVEGENVKPDWVDAARSAELADTIPRSLKKGRTVDLLYEDYTEESTFKGTMAALGCGVLIVGLVLLVLVAVFEDFGRNLGRRVPLLPNWPILLVGILGFFLLLQLLLLALRRDEPASSADADSSDPDK